MGFLMYDEKNDPEAEFCIIIWWIVQHSGNQQQKTLLSKKMMIIVLAFFRLTSSHITYPTALCIIRKMIRKTNGITV